MSSEELIASSKSIRRDDIAESKDRIEFKNSCSFVVCDDPTNHSPLVNPTAHLSVLQSGRKARSPWQWPSRSTTPPWILTLVAILDQLFVSWWLMEVLGVWKNYVPLSVKRKITFVAWKWFVRFHTVTFCRWMGFFKDTSFYDSNSSLEVDGDNSEGSRDSHGNINGVNDCVRNSDMFSDEYKALSTLCYPSQFFVVDVPRMRFALGELNVVSLKDFPAEKDIERVHFNCNPGSKQSNLTTIIPDSQQEFQTVEGLYIKNPNFEGEIIETKSRKIIFWFFGGAYLAGDANGNASLANEFMEDCDADAVFVPSYRLAPEATIDDVLWDVALAYWYLVQRLKSEQEEEEQMNDKTTEIVFVGISSGGALALRLLQLLRDRSSKTREPLMPSFLEPIMDDIVLTTSEISAKIAGAVLFGPYVDYRDPQPVDGSFVQNAKFDLVVTEAVQHYGLPYLNGFIPPMDEDLFSEKTNHESENNSVYNHHGRVQYSPISQKMHDLPPLCLVVSEHEACYDMTIEIANKARMTGTTNVTIGIWKYMCHVFSMMQALVPEGKASIDFTKEWIRSNTTQRATSKIS